MTKSEWPGRGVADPMSGSWSLGYTHKESHIAAKMYALLQKWLPFNRTCDILHRRFISPLTRLVIVSGEAFMPLQFTPHMCWGTPIVEVRNPDHARIREGLIRFSYEQEKKASTPIESGVAPKVKHGLYESRFNFFQADVKEVQELKHFCAQAVAEMVFHLHREINQNKIPLGRINVDLFESWIHITHDGGYHDSHVHPNCSWCGIYYVDIGEVTVDPPNGCNRFYAPVGLIYEDIGSLVCPLNPVQPPPEDGKLILFPSHIRHSGMPYHGKRDRILASFNAKVMRVG